MASDLIRYDLLVQDALRNVVRKVMTETAKDGLRGEHHFFITFRTKAPGLRLSERMRTRYPDEMTIILQHQFWDLSVTEHAFEVGLSFGGVPERLLVPFEALTAFSDPAAEFGLKFEPKVESEADKPVGTITKLPAGAGPKLVPHEDTPASDAGGADAAAAPKAKPAPKSKRDVVKEEKQPVVTAAAEDVPEAPAKSADEKDAKDDKIVSIDAFRKK
eukprot:gene13396-13512_t